MIRNKSLFSIVKNFFLVTSFFQIIALADQCCKKFECFECDSRFESGCGESFNLTRDTGNAVPCNEYCVKLKLFHEKEYYYLRTCSSTLKDVFIKKTQVCYSTMTSDEGSLCFCEDDLCNRASSYRTLFFNLSVSSFNYISEINAYLIFCIFLGVQIT